MRTEDGVMQVDVPIPSTVGGVVRPNTCRGQQLQRFEASTSRDPTTAERLDNDWNPETMSGSMTLVGPNKHRQSVQVKVYRTSLEHFAVLYPQKKVCRPLGVLNLRNTHVEKLTSKEAAGFVVRQRGFDTPMCLTFIMDDARDLDLWLLAFTPNNQTNVMSKRNSLAHQSSLPIVEEEEV